MVMTSKIFSERIVEFCSLSFFAVTGNIKSFENCCDGSMNFTLHFLNKYLFHFSNV